MIDLSDYTPKKRDYMREIGVHCVYAVAPKCGSPTKIGVAADMVKRMSGLQTGNWEELVVQFLLWAPGKEATIRIESEIHLQLKERHISGEWFDLHVSEAPTIIKSMAARLYPTLRFFEHEETVLWLKQKPLDKRDHVNKFKRAS